MPDEAEVLQAAPIPLVQFPVTGQKAIAVLARLRNGGAVHAIGDGGFLKIIMDLIKGLFGGFLGGICGPQTPAAVHEQVTAPTWRQENIQERQLERSVRRLRFDPNMAVAVEEAVIAEKLALTLEETTALLAEAKK